MVEPLWKTGYQFLKKVKHKYAYHLTQQLDPWTFSPGNENLSSHKSLCANVHSSFIWNSQILRTTRVSLNRGRVKQTWLLSY